MITDCCLNTAGVPLGGKNVTRLMRTLKSEDFDQPQVPWMLSLSSLEDTDPKLTYSLVTLKK